METQLRYVLLGLHGTTAERERQYRQHAELVRLQTVELLNVQVKRKLSKPQQLWPFPWDNETLQPDNQTNISPEEAQAHFNRLVEFANKLP